MGKVTGLTDLEALVGMELGPSGWITVSNQMVTGFSDVTGDRQWIHLDVERARTELPGGVPIVPGLLTLSVVFELGHGLLDLRGASRIINYGYDRVRFPESVPVATRIRATQTLRSVERTRRNTLRLTSTFVVEGERLTKPVCVADAVVLVYE